MKSFCILVLLILSLGVAAQMENSHLLKGISNAGDGDHEAAVGNFTLAIETMDADIGVAYYYRGRAYLELGEYNEALADFNKSFESASNSAFMDPHNFRGYCKMSLFDYAGAIKDFTVAIAHNPNDPEIYYNRGYSKRQLMDNSGAVLDYTKAIELRPEYAKAFLNRGVVYYDQRKFALAIEDFSKVLELMPDFANAYLNRGGAKYFNGDKKGACADWAKAEELGSPAATDALIKFCK